LGELGGIDAVIAELVADEGLAEDERRAKLGAAHERLGRAGTLLDRAREIVVRPGAGTNDYMEVAHLAFAVNRYDPENLRAVWLIGAARLRRDLAALPQLEQAERRSRTRGAVPAEVSLFLALAIAREADGDLARADALLDEARASLLDSPAREPWMAGLVKEVEAQLATR